MKQTSEDYLFYDEIEKSGCCPISIPNGTKVVYDKGRMLINIVLCQMTMEFAREHGIELKENK